MSKFEIGDRVKVIKDVNHLIKDGLKGTVCTIEKDEYSDISIGVNFDEFVCGHDCDGSSKDGYGWYVHEDEIEKIEDEIKVGNIVEVISLNEKGYDYNPNIKVGMQGMVKIIDQSEPKIGIDFGFNIEGHSLRRTAQNGHGWFLETKNVKLIRPEKLTVIIEGTKTSVTLEDGSIGVAELSQDDVYSLEKGVNIAKKKAYLDRNKKKIKELKEIKSKIIDQINELIKQQKNIEEEIPLLEQKIVGIKEEIKIIGGLK